MRTAVLLVVAVALSALVRAETIVNCPIDCALTPDVGAEIDACIVDQATLCNAYEEAIFIDDWDSLLGITDPSTVTPTSPTEVVYQPTNETVPRVSCQGLVTNDTLSNGTIVYICIERQFCYVDPEAEVRAPLSGLCLGSSLGFPGVLAIEYSGPATIFGGDFATDQLHPTHTYFRDILFDGGGTTSSFFADCMQNGNFTLKDSQFVNWRGDYVLKAESGAYHTHWELDNVTMFDIPGKPVHLEGMDGVIIDNFQCNRCAQRNDTSCVYVKMNWIATGRLWITRSSCYRVQDLLPPRCRYCITGDDGFCGSRCNEGLVQAYDRISTAQFANCPLEGSMVRNYFTGTQVFVEEYEQICRVYSPPVCNFATVIDSQNFTRIITTNVGDIVWDYDAPLICKPGGEISPIPGPWIISEFDNRLGDAVPIGDIPLLPPSPGFEDGSFEDVGWVWTASEDTIVHLPGISSGDWVWLPPLTPVFGFVCINGFNRNVKQTFQVELSDIGKPQVFVIQALASGVNDVRYTGRWIRLLIDGVEVDRFEGTDLSDQLSTSGYQPLVFQPWNATGIGSHTISVQCNFNAGDRGLQVVMDNAQWAPQSTLYSNSPIQDSTFTNHILSWQEFPIAQAISDKRGPGSCPARTGDYRFGVSNNQVHEVLQWRFFPSNGVYAIQAWVQRRNSIENYEGLYIKTVFSGVGSWETNITLDLLPTDDEYHFVTLNGQLTVTNAPTERSVRIRVDFIDAVGGAANLCIDDVSLIAIGAVGYEPDRYGFSSQTISSEPYIANMTCDCSNFTAAPRNETLLSCQYSLNDDAFCVEEEPFCCAADWLNRAPLVPTVYYYPDDCTDLANPACVFLVNCIFTPGGEVLNCSQYVCPNATGPIPLPAEANIDYLLANCALLPVAVINGTVHNSQTPNVLPVNNYDIQYTNVTNGNVWIEDTTPSAFYYLCGQANTPGCLIYTGCDDVFYDEASGNYTIQGCDLVNCTEPDLATPSTVAQLAACPVIAPDVTLTDVDGGWVYQPDGAADVFGHADWLFWLERTACGETTFAANVNPLGGLSPDCAPHPYFRECPCCPPTGAFTVPPGGNLTDPTPGEIAQQGSKTPDDYYICQEGVARCRCNEAAIDASNPAPRNSATFWIANAPDTLHSYRFLDNRYQQHQYGIVLEQISRELITSNTIVVPHRDDEQGECRETLRNDNEFGSGEEHDCLQGNPGGPYTTWCDIVPGPFRIPCPLPLTRQEQADCWVDDRATLDLPGFGNTIFNVIQDAVNRDACQSIYIRFNTRSSYFEEAIEFDKGNKNLVLWSLEGAIIVGQHTIQTNTDNITFVGLRFIHPAENRRPLFTIERNDDSNMNFVVITNSEIDGSGCRKCGVFETSRLNDLTINFTQINDFEFFALKLDDAEQVVLTHNVITDVIGRGFLIKYKEGFVVDQNALVNTRGGADLRGAAIFSFTAKRDDVCDESDLRHTCLFRHNIQIVNISQSVPRYEDLCFFFSRGALPANAIYDNACRLAETGFVFLKLTAIGTPQLIRLMQLNPLVRPSLFQIRDPDAPQFKSRLVGPDYIVRGTLPFAVPNGGNDFYFVDDAETDYDEFPFLIPFNELRCESNLNWDQRYGFGAGLTIPRMGVKDFANASVGVEFCQDRREVPPVQGGDPAPAFILYVRSFNGSRLSPENITTIRDGWLIGDDAGACCKIPLHRPALVGVRNRVLTNRWNMTNLTLALPINPGRGDMWSSGPLDYPSAVGASTEKTLELIPSEFCLDGIEVDGRYILPVEEVYAFNLLLGELIPSGFGGPATNKLPPRTEALLVVRNSIFKRFQAFDANQSPNGASWIPEQGGFPFFDGLRARFNNRLECNSTVYIDGLVVEEADKTALQIIHANDVTVRDSFFNNCSGRARGNEHCVHLLGNDISDLLIDSKNVPASEVYYRTPFRMWFINNHGLMTKRVLWPYTDDYVQPGFVPHFHIEGWPNTTDYCYLNSTARGLPLADRQEGTFNQTLINCSLYAQPASVVFPDRLRYLRAQCEAGNLCGLQGTVHDMAYGAESTDVHFETLFCDWTDPRCCCPIKRPDRCWVVQTPELLVPTNPWLGLYVFADINTAITDCAARRRIIEVVGSNDPFGTGDTTRKTYTQVFSATIPLVSLNGTGGAMFIQAGTGVRWLSTNNRLNTQCVPVTIQGFDFEHDGTPNVAIWQQTAGTGTDACNMRFLGNQWNLTIDARAMNVVVGDNFTISDNRFTANLFADVRRGVELRGNGSCTEYPITVEDSKFEDIAGFGLDVREVALYRVNRNTFDNTGGRDSLSQIPYSVYASVCDVPPSLPSDSGPVQFNDNRVRTTQTATAAVGCMATCWLGNVPYEDKPFEILNNDCRGLEFGMRFENMTDNSPSNDPKAQLRSYALRYGNIRTEGFKVPPLDKRFDLVRGPPEDDASLKSDPNSDENKGRWCTAGCPTDVFAILWALLALLGVCLFLLCMIGLCTQCCIPRELRDPLLVMRQGVDPEIDPTTLGNSWVSPFYGETTPLAPGHYGASVGAELHRRPSVL